MFIITELMAHGDLQHFLMNDAGKTVNLPGLIRFAVQVRLYQRAQQQQQQQQH